MILELLKRLRQGLELMGRSPEDYVVVLPPDLFIQLQKRLMARAQRFVPPHAWYGDSVYVSGILVRPGMGEDIVLKAVED